MNNYLRPKYLPLYTLILSLAGLLLRLWTLGDGPNADNLYTPNPLAWTLLWVVTAGTAVLILYLVLPLKHPGSYRQNFPASIPSTVGTVLAAFAIMVSGLDIFADSDLLSRITGLLGILSAMALVSVAFARFKGSRPSFLLHAVMCLFLALRIFIECKQWSNEPQLGVFIMPFLASVSIMLASYQQVAFDVDLGDRRHSLFWSLMGTFFCATALPASDEPVFYGLMAAWLLTNLCSLRHLKPKAPESPAEPKQEQ